MIGIIARKEFTELVRDGRFRWASLTLVALLMLSALSAWHNRSAAERQRHDAGESIHKGWLEQGETSGHNATHYGTWAIKPSTLLSALDPGIESYAGTAVFLEAHRRNADLYRPAASGTSAQRFGSWSAAAILQVLVPLLIIVVAFPAFAGEREQGTLRQLASLGVSMRPVAMGKIMGIAAALATVLIPVTLLGAMLLEPGKVLALAVVYLAYFSVVLAVVLAVSARASSARTALVTLLGLWAITTLAIPRASSDLARYFYPTPSSFQFAQSIRGDLKGLTIVHRGVDAAATTRALLAGEARSSAVYERHYRELYKTYVAQDRIHTLASLASPALAVRALSMAIAGTDLQQHWRFIEAAEAHRNRMVVRLNEADIAQRLRGPQLWASIPQFSFNPAGLQAALAPHRSSALVLTAWLVLAVLLFASLRRVRVS